MNRTITLPILLILSACADPNSGPLTEGSLDWETCALQVDGAGEPTQCTTTQMPLWWDEPEGETIEIFAQRHLAKDATQVLWMLPGGPGQTGAVYEGYVKNLAKQLDDTDIYVFEHRGVGRSTRLSCPEQESSDSPDGYKVTAEEWPDCLDAAVDEWGEDLAAFSSSAGADDLAEWIRLTADGRPAFVYGGSYGTTLAHRFLQQHPDLADGVILDSLALDVDHREYDAEFDEVARQLLGLCGDDDRCSEALGSDAEATAEDIMADVTAGSCPAIDAEILRAGAATFAGDASMRGYAPAMYHRAGRCTEDDQEEIERLISLFQPEEPHYTQTLHSPLLFANIELSEQWPEPWPTLEELEAVQSETLFSFGLGSSQRPLLDIWPRYPFDQEVDTALAVTDTPILMMHGGFDPLTPPWRADGAEAHFTGPGQHMVRFPQGTHILVGSTPSKGGDCATQLLVDFLDDPMAEPDESCVDDIKPIKFSGKPFMTKLMFTDFSRYGDGCGGGSEGGQALVFLPLGLGFFLRRRREG